jgi:hypothetical protein
MPVPFTDPSPAGEAVTETAYEDGAGPTAMVAGALVPEPTALAATAK